MFSIPTTWRRNANGRNNDVTALGLLVTVWLCGNALVAIKVPVVDLHRARLVLGWVTVCG